MPKPTNPRTIQRIKILWQHRLPPKVIADALQINYPVVTLYCRSFSPIYEQHSALAIANQILNNPINTTGQEEE